MPRETVEVTLNFMGSPVPDDFARRILDGEYTAEKSTEYVLAESFLGLPLRFLPQEILARYAELSDKSLYLPFLPLTDKLFERLLMPFRSAKRCYCFGEYLGSIELCAHVAEMLAQLVWEMEPLTRDPDERSAELEIAFFGSRFEKLGQERRVRILTAANRITSDQSAAFTYIRTTRRKYFHLWSHSTEGMDGEAKACFGRLSFLVSTILQISISSTEPGKVVVNPALSRYLDRMHNTV